LPEPAAEGRVVGWLNGDKPDAVQGHGDVSAMLGAIESVGLAFRHVDRFEFEEVKE